MSKTMAIGNDHAGLELKLTIIKYLEEQGWKCIDCGCHTTEPAAYPEIGVIVCETVTSGQADMGILICGSGIGMSMVANKLAGIRAAMCSEPLSAHYTRLHNDANVLCMGARMIGSAIALEIVKQFITTEFEGGRHIPRVESINALGERS